LPAITGLPRCFGTKTSQTFPCGKVYVYNRLRNSLLENDTVAMNLSRALKIVIWCVPLCLGAEACFGQETIPVLGQVSENHSNDQQCLSCHGETDKGPAIHLAALQHSAHGKMACVECHTNAVQTPHPAAVTAVSCGTCHANVQNALMNSDHGKALNTQTGVLGVCTACHGEAHAIAGLTKAFNASAGKAAITANCIECHNKRPGKDSASASVTFTENPHAVRLIAAGPMKSAACSDCHGGHDINLAANPVSHLFWQNIPATCGACHADILKAFRHSIHGKAVAAGKREAPVCTDCHGEHSIKSVGAESSQVSMNSIPDTCGQCHASKRITSKFQLPDFVVGSYKESYHGLSIQRGSLTEANCASCHNAHDILPSSDPASSIHSSNLVKTCGQCHKGIGEQLINGKIHLNEESPRISTASKAVKRFYLLLIAVVVGGMLVHNILDLLKKARARYRYLASLGKSVRMGVNERRQHLVLVISFLTLAYTGFALKFPHAWWAAPFAGAMNWRGLGHRYAAVAFIGLSLYHAWFMLFTAKGRWHLKALAPGWNDLVQCGQAFAYYVGKRRERPRPGFYGYIEKMEYWALVWGAIIMTVTGGCLLYKEFFLKYFPKWLLDALATVHLYEAALACLAIIVWHGYFIILDPDVYPMKFTWITGSSDPSDDERTTASDSSAPPQK
jgi:cytochrome b subunit of formate dehydrogenase